LTEIDPLAALSDPDGSAIGSLYYRDQLWGYLLVRPDAIEWRRWFRSSVEPAIVEEMYRILPPGPKDVNWGNKLGWMDEIIRGDELSNELARLRRGEMLLTGRTLSIEWLYGDEAARVRQRFFTPPHK
jgi:hypothetical protein